MGLFDGGAGDAADALKKYYKKSLQFGKPYRKLGEWSIEPIKEVDPSGGAGNVLDTLKGFKFNPEDAGYQSRLGEAERGVNRFLASRGLYNSRAGANILQDTGQKILGEEQDKQYGRLVDQFNFSRALGSDQFNKLFSLLGVGANASGQAANSALQTGQGLSSAAIAGGQSQLGFASDLLGLPVDFLTLKYLFGSGNKQGGTA